MPALDQCHHQVVRALEKAGWYVNRAPYTLTPNPDRTLFADMELRRQENESGEQVIIVVEAKCFPEFSAETNELYTAIGQYLVYRSIMRQQHIDKAIYLALPTHAYDGVFTELALPLIEEIGLKIVVIDLDSEVIERWLP